MVLVYLSRIMMEHGDIVRIMLNGHRAWSVPLDGSAWLSAVDAARHLIRNT